ncbi:MAG: hypothetical protein IPP74_15075 [Alphaproteobacteria bacterium]|nr:hypothetical protein [Alphaproteobacteria bacterium]
MKIISVNKCIEIVFYVETDDEEPGSNYRRGEHGGWEQLMGESWETCYFKEDEIESLFKQFMLVSNRGSEIE